MAGKRCEPEVPPRELMPPRSTGVHEAEASIVAGKQVLPASSSTATARAKRLSRSGS